MIYFEFNRRRKLLVQTQFIINNTFVMYDDV